MRQRAGRWVCVLLLASLRAAAADERVIAYDKDTLTVRLTRVPVTEVLDELSRQTGADIRGQVRAPGDVSAAFDDVPLPEALHRLLGNQNFALIYGDGGRLKAVRLLGGPQASAAATGVPPTAPGVQTTPMNLASLLARHQPVAVTGNLADAVGSPYAGLQQLFDVGARHDDASVRAEALRLMVATLESDPALRQAVLGELGTLDDGSLSALLRGAAGERAEEVAMQILTQARASELRVKASSVLQRLRSGS